SWLLANCADARLRDPARAVQLAQRALELEEPIGNLWNTLGVAHYRAGNWNAAIEALNKSCELRKGGDAFDWFCLAMAHEQTGNLDEGRKWYERAVKWMLKNAPQNAELRRFRLEVLDGGVAKWPSNVQILRERGDLHLAENRPE